VSVSASPSRSEAAAPGCVRSPPFASCVIRRCARSASHGVEIADALIAAAAHVHGLTLCSRNLRHYPMRDLKKLRV